MKNMKRILSSALLISGLALAPMLSGCGGEIDGGQESAQAQAVVAAAFDITGKGIFGGTPFIRVAGTAGSTKPSATSPDAYAYLFNTDQGIFIVESHNAKDHPLQFGTGDRTYHAHQITLDAANCIATQKNNGVPQLSGNQARVIWTLFNVFNKAQTVRIAPSAGKRCIAEVFDTL